MHGSTLEAWVFGFRAFISILMRSFELTRTMWSFVRPLLATLLLQAFGCLRSWRHILTIWNCWMQFDLTW